jgi:hypothetical protein
MKYILILFYIFYPSKALYSQNLDLKSNENQVFMLTDIQKLNSSLLDVGKSQDLSFSLFQIGNKNTVAIKILAKNTLDFLQQGDGNIIEATFLGENNIIKFQQYGNNNLLQLNDIMSTNGMLEILQEGNGNVLVESGYGLNIPIRIEQKGGMKIEINSKASAIQ